MASIRFHPTKARAAELRAVLASLGAKATVAVQPYALRIIARTDADRALASAAAISLGFGGPTGGDLARSADCLFAYDFRGARA